MMFFRALLLCCLIIFTLPVASHGDIPDDPRAATESLIIDPEYNVPAFPTRWRKYITYLEQLDREIIALEATLKTRGSSLKDALEADMAALKQRRANTADDILFYRNYKKSLSVWRKQFSRRTGRITPQALAWGLQQQKLKYAPALGLMYMARAYGRDGELVPALNLATLALNGRLPKADRHDLARDYDLWLGNATLRAGDAVYNLEVRPISACIAFAHPLAEKQPLPLDDYIRTDNGQKLALSLKGRSLCLSGLNYGDNFSLTLRRGLVAENGAVLAADAKRLIKVTDREPSLRFNSDKWLAPLTGSEMIAAYGVNLARANLTLIRIGERAMRAAIQEGIFTGRMRDYQAGKFKNQLGETVWQGTVDLSVEKNVETTTLIPVRQMLKDMKPGLYMIKADWEEDKENINNRRWQRDRPVQWILFSDTGLTAITGNDGLTILSRHISNAKPRSGVTLKLIAVNNEILGQATSNRKGIARFPAALLRGEGGSRPSHLIAEAGGGDFTMLRLNRDSLNLSDFDVTGRTVLAEGDMYLFTERSVYRAGEKVFLTGFLRDNNARALPDRRLELKLFRPDGTEDRKIMLTGDDLGAYAYDFSLSPTARTGRWRVTVSYAGETTSLAGAGFSVQDFVPLRLKVALTSDSKMARDKAPLDLSLAADFLYGAPASELGSQLRATLQATSRPFPDYGKYHFGLLDDNFSSLSLFDKKGKLSPQGKQSLSLMVDQTIHTTRPLEIRATATVFDVGGRPASASLRLPYRHEDVMVGLHMGDIITQGSSGLAKAHLVALTAAGEPVKNRELSLTWIKEDHDYQWYQRGGYWRSKTVIYDTLIAETNGQTDGNGLLEAARTLPNGTYRLEVADGAGTSRASIRFHVGWWSHNRQANEPDQLDLKLATTELRDGERLRGQVTAPFDGKVTVMVVTDRVHLIRALTLTEGTADFNLKVNKDWGTGAYIMATAFRPTGKNKADDAHLPVRATGFAWFDIGHADRQLSVKLMPPETVLPRKSAAIPLKITGLEKGEQARVTLLAVDEGILRLMGYASPSLTGYFMGKRALGLRIHDLYGRLLLGEEGRRGTLSTGGDSFAEKAMSAPMMMTDAVKSRNNRAGLTTRTRRAVALISRDVTVGADGRAEITLDMPDFVGQLRLMAVAYSARKMGQAVAPLIVRDPVAADLILPRFMAPGDQANPVISLQNLSGKPQTLTLSLKSDGPVTAPLQRTDKFTLVDQERRDIPLPITATGVGVARFELTVSGLKEPIMRSWTMAVRAPYGFESRTEGRMLAAGESLTLSPTLSPGPEQDFITGSSLTSVMLSNAPDLKLDKMLGDLYRYRYMCTEQTVSRAMPMLYADRLVKAGLSDRDMNSYAAEIDQAVERLLMRQNRAGDFGLWRAYDHNNPWASLYAIDFLMQARDAGYHVPDVALTRAFDWIRSLRTDQTHHALMSYALYLRARAGNILRGDIRHYAVTTVRTYHSPMTEAYLGAALALVGEDDLAITHFKQALTTRWRPDPDRTFYNYGSMLRDRAATITLLAESGLAPELLFEAGTALERLTAQQTWFNTHQSAWLVRAASLLSGDETLSLAVNDKNLDNLKASWGQDIIDTITVANTGSQPIRFIKTTRGMPAQPPEPVQNGATIHRRYLDLKGKRVDIQNIQQNDRFIVLITGENKRIGTEASLILDLLPAGLEIENATVGGDSQLRQYGFLPHLSRARYSSELDDRYFAVLDNRRRGSFAFAYMVRAITPGTYVQPPVMIEDMYQPEYRAIGKAGSLTIHGNRP